MTIVGNRLYIRPIDKDDAEGLANAINLSLNELTATQPWMIQPVSVKEELIFIEASVQKMLLNKSLTYGIFLKNRNDYIGTVSTHMIDWGNFKTEIGYWVSSPYTGKGYATEACVLMLEYLFMELKMHRVAASVAQDNPASLRVAEKLNFSFEGVAKEAIHISGKWKDLNVYALLTAAYRASRKATFTAYVGGVYPRIQY